MKTLSSLLLMMCGLVGCQEYVPNEYTLECDGQIVHTDTNTINYREGEYYTYYGFSHRPSFHQTCTVRVRKQNASR